MCIRDSACNKAAKAADAKPFPRDETTPPVINIKRAMDEFVITSKRRIKAKSYQIRKIIISLCIDVIIFYLVGALGNFGMDGKDGVGC